MAQLDVIPTPEESAAIEAECRRVSVLNAGAGMGLFGLLVLILFGLRRRPRLLLESR